MPQDYDHLSHVQLIELLKRRDSERTLGLVWERNEIESDNSINDDFVLFDKVSNLSVGTDSHKNFIMEADNFDALRWLRMTHRGAIKCIYIDPPYNTRNKSFVFNDNYVDPNDRYVHSKWLEYMYQRVRLAHDLLAPDGLLFISIDDGEVARLRLLMDQIFPTGFMACLIWQSDGKFDNQAKFKVNHEYVLVYSIDRERISAPPVLDPNMPDSSKLFNSQILNAITKNGPKNPISQIVLPVGFPTDFEAGLIEPRSSSWPKVLNRARVENFALMDSLTLESGWSSKALCNSFINNGFSAVRDQKDQLTSFVLTKHGVIQYFKPRADEQSYVLSVIRNVGTTEKAKNDLKKVGVTFDYPKPVNLIKYLLSMVPGNDFTVLDFFAGTGTTGEAVMELNRTDGGHRNFILVSSTEATREEPDKNICRDACAKRLAAYFSKPINKTGVDSHFGFSYLRATTERFSDLDLGLTGPRIWLILQSAYGVPVCDYDASKDYQSFDLEEFTVVYTDKISATAIEHLKKTAKTTRMIIYCWTPGQLRDELQAGSSELRPLPISLVERFRR